MHAHSHRADGGEGRGRVKLTREIRTRIMAGECPFIGGEGIAPIKAGYVWRLSQYVEVRVDRVDHKKGKWSARYTVIDSRDLRASADKYLRRVPRPEDFETLRESFDQDGYPMPIETDAASAAESAYTNRADLAIDPAPVVPAEYQAKLSKAAAPSNEVMRERRRKALSARIGRTLKAAHERGIESYDARLERIEAELNALDDELAA